MKFYYKRNKIENDEKLKQWHDYFCLLPRTIDDVVVWMETVQRRGSRRQSTRNRYEDDIRYFFHNRQFNWIWRIPSEETFRRLKETKAVTEHQDEHHE